MANIRPGSMSRTEALLWPTLDPQTRLDESDGGPLMADIVPFESRHQWWRPTLYNPIKAVTNGGEPPLSIPFEIRYR